jgi:hypothetical protein
VHKSWLSLVVCGCLVGAVAPDALAQEDDIFTPDVFDDLQAEGEQELDQANRDRDQNPAFAPAPAGGAELDPEIFDPFGEGNVELENVPTTGTLPPASERRQIDQVVADRIGAAAQAYADELARLRKLEKENTSAARGEVHDALSRSAAELGADLQQLVEAHPELVQSNPTLQEQIDQLNRRIAGDDDRPAAAGDPTAPGSYGTPLSLDRPYSAPSRQSDSGAEQFTFWEEQLHQAIAPGDSRAVQEVAENRLNSLKARGDQVALDAAPEHRPYVNNSVRQTVENTLWGGSDEVGEVYDSRLDDLILGSANSGGQSNPSQPNPAPISESDDWEERTLRVQPLPRVRDPITGEERVIVDLALGVDPAQPIRGR